MGAADQLQKTACPQQTGLHEIFPVDLVSSQKNVDRKLSFQHLANDTWFGYADIQTFGSEFGVNNRTE